MLERLKGLFAWLDKRADARLGFISQTFFASALGGGIVPWLVTRGIVVLAILMVSGHYLRKYRDHIIDSRDRVWEKSLREQMNTYENELLRRAKETREQLAKIQNEWRELHKSLEKDNEALEHELMELRKQPVVECIPPPAVDTLRKKARRINQGGYLK